MGKFPLTYLGLPIHWKKLCVKDWDPLVERLQSQLDNWKEGAVYFGVNLVMLNAVLSAIPTYWLSLYKLPVKVRKKWDSIRSNFLWNGPPSETKKYHLVIWDRVCKKKEFGGLGVLNLQDFNQALIGKWWWK